MPLKLRISAVLVPSLLALAFASSADATIFRIKPMDLQRTAFVSKDVSRFSNPRNCDDPVLESVLQEMYRINPGLSEDDAVAAVKNLKKIGQGTCRSRASSNEAILTFLKKLNEQRPGGTAGKAVLEVTRDALAGDLQDAGITGSSGSFHRITATRDSFATLSSEEFDPATLLSTSFTVARENRQFGNARDTLWGGETGASIYDSSESLLSGPEFAGARNLTSLIDPDGSMTFSEALPSVVIKSQFAAVNLATDKAQDDVVAVEDADKKKEAELTALKDRVKEDAKQRGEILDNAETSLQFAVMVVGTFDKETAKDLEQVGKVAFKGARLFNKLADTAGSLSVNIATGNVFGVMKDLLGVATELGPIFGEMPKSPEEMVQDQLGEITKDIAAFRDDVNERFDHVDKQLVTISNQMVTAFQTLDAKLRNLDRNVKSVIDQLTTLQASLGSVERRLYETIKGAADLDLWTDINTAIGWRDRSVGGAPMSGEKFLDYEGRFYSWGTNGATGFALVPDPRRYDPGSLEDELNNPVERNVDYFSRFAQEGLGLAALSSEKLPNPRDWAVAARAHSALLLENPEYATAGVADRIVDLEHVGMRLRDAFAKVSARDASTGTHNTVLNAALGNYRRWATAPGAGGQADSMLAALRREEDEYMAGLTPNPLRLDLWGGADQDPQSQDVPAAAKMPRCGDDSTTIDSLSAPKVRDLLPNAALVAQRLGIGQTKVCWSASWTGRRTSQGSDDDAVGKLERRNYIARLQVTVRSLYGDQALRSREFTGGEETWCFETYDRQTGQRVSGACPANPPEAGSQAAARWGTLRGTFEASSTLSDGGRLDAIRTAVNTDLKNKQDALYARILESFQRKDLRAAATRLNGAEQLVDGYVTLGLPRALDQDDELHALLRGDDRLLDDAGEGRISTLYAEALGTSPAVNPRLTIERGLAGRADALEGALARNLPTSAAGSGSLTNAVDPGSATAGPESIPLVETTLARLALTREIVSAPEQTTEEKPQVEEKPEHHDEDQNKPGDRHDPQRVDPAPSLSLTVARQKLKAALARGLTLQLSSNGPATVTTELVLPAKGAAKAAARSNKAVVVGKVTTKFAAAGKKKVVVKFTKKGKSLLRRAKNVSLTVRTTAVGPSGASATAERKIALKR